MSKIRVLIVDDQKLFASSLRTVLQRHAKGEIDVVGIAQDGQESIRLIENERPDVVLMDVRMPVMDGVEATAIIAKMADRPKIMILTTFDDDDYVFQALQNGADGYILKNIEPDELINSVRAVYSGQFIVSSSVGSKLINHIDFAVVRDEVSDPVNMELMVPAILDSFPNLTRREAQVLGLIAENWDNHEISDRLCIAEQTVKNYTSRIYDKIGVPDRLHAIQAIRAMVR